jgi:hypothetical protein
LSTLQDKLRELKSKIDMLPYVKAGDMLLSQHHNLKVDALRLIHDILSEMAVAPPGAPPTAPVTDYTLLDATVDRLVQAVRAQADVDYLAGVLQALHPDHTAAILSDPRVGVDLASRIIASSYMDPDYAATVLNSARMPLDLAVSILKSPYMTPARATSILSSPRLGDGRVLALATGLGVLPYARITGVITNASETYPYGIVMPPPLMHVESFIPVRVDVDSRVQALILANMSSWSGNTFVSCTVTVDNRRLDESIGAQTSYGLGYPSQELCMGLVTLEPGSHIVSIQWAPVGAGSTTVNNRQIAVLLAPRVLGRMVVAGRFEYSDGPVMDGYSVVEVDVPADMDFVVVYNVQKWVTVTYGDDRRACMIGVDGTPLPESTAYTSAYSANDPYQCTSVALVRLTAGRHTVAGYYTGAVGGQPLRTHARQIAVIPIIPPLKAWFRGPGGLLQTTTTVVDNDAVLDFTLDSESDVIILYNASNGPGYTEDTYGKRCYLEVDGVPYLESEARQSPGRYGYPNSVTCMLYERLPAGTHTVRPYVGPVRTGYTITVSVRQLLVLAAPATP